MGVSADEKFSILRCSLLGKRRLCCDICAVRRDLGCHVEFPNRIVAEPLVGKGTLVPIPHERQVVFDTVGVVGIDVERYRLPATQGLRVLDVGGDQYPFFIGISSGDQVPVFWKSDGDFCRKWRTFVQDKFMARLK